jgi:hypothetical protein
LTWGTLTPALSRRERGKGIALKRNDELLGSLCEERQDFVLRVGKVGEAVDDN